MEAEEQERQRRVTTELENPRMQQETSGPGCMPSCFANDREEEMIQTEYKTRLLESRLEQRKLEEELEGATGLRNSQPALNTLEFGSAPAAGATASGGPNDAHDALLPRTCFCSQVHHFHRTSKTRW